MNKTVLLDPVNHISRLITAAVIAMVLVSPVGAQAGPRSHPMDEDAALALLVRTLKHDRVYAKRISLDCFTYDTEETTNAYFQFARRPKSVTPSRKTRQEVWRMREPFRTSRASRKAAQVVVVTISDGEQTG